MCLITELGCLTGLVYSKQYVTSTQADVLNMVTLTALRCYKLHFIILQHGTESTQVNDPRAMWIDMYHNLTHSIQEATLMTQ